MKRTPQSWMKLHQEIVDQLSEIDWEHYEAGGCVCFATSWDACICGAWDEMTNDD